MILGSVCYSIKYDIGGRIPNLAQLIGTLRPHWQVSVSEPDIELFNFSYLSYAWPILILDDSTIELGGLSWRVTMSIDSSGTVSFLMRSTNVTAPDGAGFVDRMLEIHHQFLTGKNRDYIRYLESHGSLTRSLEHLRPSGTLTDPGVLDFGSRVDDLRRLVRSRLIERPLYVFHDFRPIFLIDRESMLTDLEKERLLSLPTPGIPSFTPRNGHHASHELWGQTVLGNTWAFLVETGVSTDVLLRLFSHVHTHWYVAQASLYELRELDEHLVTQGNRVLQNRGPNVEDLARMVRRRKNEVFHQLFEIRSSDFITKNNSVNSAFDFFANEFHISAQLELLDKHIERLAEFLADFEMALQELRDRSLRKVAATLEVLFAVSAIVGITGLVSVMFASDLRDSISMDTPRYAALAVALGATVFYVATLAFWRTRHGRDGREI